MKEHADLVQLMVTRFQENPKLHTWASIRRAKESWLLKLTQNCTKCTPVIIEVEQKLLAHQKLGRRSNKALFNRNSSRKSMPPKSPTTTKPTIDGHFKKTQLFEDSSKQACIYETSWQNQTRYIVFIPSSALKCCRRLETLASQPERIWETWWQ